MRAMHNQLCKAGWLLAMLIVMLCFGLASAMIEQEKRSSAPRASQKLVGEQETANKSTEPPFMPPQPVSCSAFAILVDTALVEWQEMQATYLIFIVRLGEGEKASLNRSRLRDIEDYLRRHSTIKYVTAEGSRVKGLGRVELYVGGKLRTVIPIKKNDKYLCSGKVNPFL